MDQFFFFLRTTFSRTSNFCSDKKFRQSKLIILLTFSSLIFNLEADFVSETHSLNHIDQEQGNTRNTIIVDNKLIREKHLQLKDEAFAPLNVLILQNEYTVYTHTMQLISIEAHDEFKTRKNLFPKSTPLSVERRNQMGILLKRIKSLLHKEYKLE